MGENKIDFQKANDLLDSLEEKLEAAMLAAEELSNLLGDHPVAGRISDYLVGTLDNFLCNKRQCGSIPDIRRDLRCAEQE